MDAVSETSMDKQTFIQNLAQLRRRKILFIRIGASLLFITLCTAMGLTKTSLSPQGLLIFKVVAIAGFAALVYSFIVMLQNMSRRLGLHCPSCNRNLSGPLSHKVISSDQCFQCGMKLF
jgi:hypothetical protein